MHTENVFPYTNTREFFKKQNVTISPIYFFVTKLFECIHFSTFPWNWRSTLKLFVVWHVVEWCKFESEFTTLFWCKGAYLEAKSYHY